LKRFRSARWYIASKENKPEWLAVDGLEDRIALRVLWPEATSERSGLDAWILKGKMSRLGYDELSQPAAYDRFLLSPNGNLVGRIGEGGKRYVVSESRNGNDAVRAIGWASSVFARLIHRSITDARFDASSIGEAAKWADDKRMWPTLRGTRVEPRSGCRIDAWDEERQRWEAAFKDAGIVDVGGEPQLQIWRSWTDLDGYVACIPRKRRTIRQIMARIRDFQDGGHQRNLAMMFRADPGAGKTQLAELLAKTFGLKLLTCDVSQMFKHEQLIDFFDQVRAEQSDPKSRVLVFVDEINSPFGQFPPYSTFLSPVENMTYETFGRKSRLQPCIWLFAGTPASTDAPKWPDLLSRFSGVFDLDYGSMRHETKSGQRATLEAFARLEQVYLGALRLGKDRQWVDEKILWRFWSFNPENASVARVIRKLVMMLSSVRGAVLRAKDCPEEFFVPQDGLKEKNPSRTIPDRLIRLVLE
jgi:hypothetical protein